MSEINKDPNVNWRDNRIQFPRLIAELQAVGGFSAEIMHALSEEMALPQSAVAELIERAEKEWQQIKSCTLTGK